MINFGTSLLKIARSWYRNEGATLGAEIALKLFSSHGEFDYKAFSGLYSRGASILAMAGLDLKRLPKMNNRDKGRVLEQELGM